MQERTISIVLDPSDVWQALAGKIAILTGDIPKDAKVRRCGYELLENRIIFVIEHESFEPVEDGYAPPRKYIAKTSRTGT